MFRSTTLWWRCSAPALPRGSAASSVESVRLDPDLKRDLLLRAAQDHTGVSEIVGAP